MLIVACNSNSDLQPVTCNLQITPSGYEGSNSGFAIKPKKKGKQQAYTKTQWNTSQVKSFLLISLKEK